MSTSRFDSEFFAGNRKRLRELFTGTAPIVLTAHGQLQMIGDQAYPFQQDASFWYFTGIDEPGVVLVMDKDDEYLIFPSRDPVLQLFDGSVDSAAVAKLSGISQLLSETEGWKRLSARLGRAKHVATLPAAPSYIEHYAMYTNPARRQLIKKLKSYNADIELLDISQHIARLRVVKQRQELDAIERAIAITMATLKDVTRARKMEAYQHEYELEAAITYGFRRRGADGHAFEPIVAGGKRACVLHYHENNAALGNNELVVLDVGAAVDHYPADITRTVIKGTASRRQRAVHAAVEEVLEYGIDQLKPGVSFADCEARLTEYMGEKLRSLGLIKTIDKEAIHRFYPHAPHYLGLSVHDVGDYHAPLEPGMVLTVEPGIYIPEVAIGVRIEQDVVITADGCRVLTASLPTQLQ